MELAKNISHKVQRQAFSILIDRFLANLDKTENRTATYLKLVDQAEKFWGKDGARKESLDKVRAAFKDPDNRWVKFLNKVIDEE